MINDNLPAENVQDVILQNTSTILNNRAEQPEITERQFFNADLFNILKAVSVHLVPQTDRLDKIDLANKMDEYFAERKPICQQTTENSFDGELFKVGLKGIDETSEALFGDNFTDLDDAEQDSVLTAVQKGDAQGETWKNMSSKLFFDDLLGSFNELYNITKNEMDTPVINQVD